MYCFIRNTFFKNLGDAYELETGSDCTEDVNLVLSDPPHNTRRTQSQSSFAHGLVSKSGMEDAVTLLGSVVASGARGHISCSDKMLHY